MIIIHLSLPPFLAGFDCVAESWLLVRLSSFTSFFSGNGAAGVGSLELATLVKQAAARVNGLKLHADKVVVCMEGPAFSTRAESQLYRSIGGDIINMSVLPEAKLAREAEIPYQMICMSTDYDAWKEHEEAVTTELVIGHLNANAESARKLLAELIPLLGEGANPLKGSIKNAVITAPEKRNPEQLKKLAKLLPGTF